MQVIEKENLILSEITKN